MLRLFFLLLGMPLHVGFAQALPSEVLNEVGELDEVCAEHGGTPDHSDFVKHAVVGVDRLEVWIINDGLYGCRGSALWPGHWGSNISIYARLPSDKVKKVFDVAALEVSIQSGDSPSRIWIRGWGEMCGLSEPESDEEWAVAKTCRRPLTWDGTREKIVFSPLSEMQTHR